MRSAEVKSIRRAMLAFAPALAIAGCFVSFPDYPVGDIHGGGAGGAVSGVDSGTSGSGGTAGVRAGGGAAGSNAGGASGGTAGAGTGGTAGAGTGGTAGAGTGGAAGGGGTAGTSDRGRLVINEVDYDQINTDSMEFVEIYNASSVTARLDGVSLVLVNGGVAPPAEYSRFDLSGTLAGHGFAVVASPLVPVPSSGVLVFDFPMQNDNIQNGAPDALGLLDTESHALLDALSYEGSVQGAVLDGETGTFDFVEGTPTAQVDVYSQTMSLVRIPDGNDTNDASADWSVTLTPTPGAPNRP